MTGYFAIGKEAVSITNQIPQVTLKFLALGFSTFSELFTVKPAHAFKIR